MTLFLCFVFHYIMLTKFMWRYRCDVTQALQFFPGCLAGPDQGYFVPSVCPSLLRCNPQNEKRRMKIRGIHKTLTASGSVQGGICSEWFS